MATWPLRDVVSYGPVHWTYGVPIPYPEMVSWWYRRVLQMEEIRAGQATS